MMTQQIKAFRKKIAAGPVFGPFAKTCDPAFIEVAGHAGFDFVIIDLEHGPAGVETAQNLVRAAAIAGVLPIVRVKEHSPPSIGEVLDIGAAGIQVPQVRTAADATEAVRRARFGKGGERGVCRFVRAADYSSLDRARYLAEANETLVILQLEGTEAIANLSEISKVKGVDILFIGPYDLSQSLGVPGEIDHPRVTEKMAEIAQACRSAGIVVGTFVDTPANAEAWLSRGVRYLSYSVDVGIFTEACRAIVHQLGGMKR